MPRLPGICTLSPLDAALTMRFAKNMQHDTSKVLRLPRKMTMDTSKVCTCHENCNSSCENVAKVLHLPHKTTFDTLQNTSECHEVPRLPRETKQRDVWNRQKWFILHRTYHRHGHIWPSRGRLRTVANGCGRLRTVASINATSSEHTLNPQTGPPEWNGNHCYEFGKVATRKAKRTRKNEPVYF